MKKRIFRSMALASALMFCVSGCGITTDISLANIEEEIELEMSWWGTDERHTYTIEALKEYSTRNPGVRIDMTYGEFSGFELKNDVKMFANTDADVMQINYPWLEKYQGLGLEFYDLSTLDGVLDLSQYDENELSYGRNKEGKLIALPIAANVKVIWYNQTIYDKYGLEIPKTWDDLFAAAKVMKKDGICPVDMDNTASWMACIAYVEQTTGHQIFDENQLFSFSEEDVKMMLEFYQKMVSEGVIECTAERNESRLSEGTYAGTMQWISGATKYEDMMIESGGTVTAALPPTVDGEKRMGWYVKPATLYSISSHTEEPQEAAKLLSYLVEDEGMVARQKLDKGVPCNAKAVEILKASGDLAGTQYETSVAMEEKGYPLMSPYLEVSAYTTAFQNANNEVLYGEATLEEAAKTAYETMKAVEKSR